MRLLWAAAFGWIAEWQCGAGNAWLHEGPVAQLHAAKRQLTQLHTPAFAEPALPGQTAHGDLPQGTAFGMKQAAWDLLVGWQLHKPGQALRIGLTHLIGCKHKVGPRHGVKIHAGLYGPVQPNPFCRSACSRKPPHLVTVA